MAFDTSNHWSDFQNVDSGKNGTVEGLIPLEGAASAFRYRKVIRVDVAGADPSNPNLKIKGNWKVRVRADPSKNADGSRAGALLFEQEMVWTALVTAFDLGGLLAVSWQPQGPSGSGEQRTSFVAGETCAVIENVYAPKAGEMEAYGETGAWRFLNEVPVKPDEVPGDKYNAERGFVAPETFDPNGSLGVGAVSFYCEWQSAGYTFDIPEGAILETVFDRWQVGTIDKHALYRVSTKTGTPDGFDVLRDARAGVTWIFKADKGVLLCQRTLRREPVLSDAPSARVTPSKAKRWKSFLSGATLQCVVETSSATLEVLASTTHGAAWFNQMTLPDGVQLLCACPSPDAGTVYVLGKTLKELPVLPLPANGQPPAAALTKNTLVRLLISSSTKADGSGEYVIRVRDKISGDIPLPGSTVGTLSLDETSFTWSYADKDKNVVLLRSYDECASWTQWAARPTDTT